MKRIVALDYMRILSCILVIGIHGVWLLSPENDPGNNLILYTVVNHIVRLGLPSFFILSAIALTNPSDMLSGLNKFYTKKFFILYLPFLMWSVYYYESSNGLLHSMSGIILNIPKALYSSLTQSQHYHMWYMYTLIGLIILEPFLKRLLDNLSHKELFLLCCILLVAKALNIFGIVKIGELYFGSWVIYYIIGSFLIREETMSLYPIIICSSIIAFFLSLGIDYYFTESIFMNNIFEYSPLMVIQVGGIFSIFLWIDRIRKPILYKIIKYLSKFTFQIYLAHPAVMNFTVHNLWFLKSGILSNHSMLFFVVVVTVTFVGAVVVAGIIEGIIWVGKMLMIKIIFSTRAGKN